MSGDEYGIRTALLGYADGFLDEKQMRWLIDRFWERSDEESDRYKGRHWTLGIESLARQLKDPALFEKARTIAWPENPDGAFLDIAAVYLQAGDPEAALERVGRIKQLPGHKVDEMDRLLLSIYRELGDDDKMMKAAWRIFRRSRSKRALDSLLSVIGEENRQTVVGEETASILASERFSYSDAHFLIEVSGTEQAEAYLLFHQQSLGGELYDLLKPMAESLEKEAPLGATIVYRALLDSILSRAISRYYHHGVRYLRKLDELEACIEDWKGLPPHLKYRSELLSQHGRKSSFWSKYPGS